MEVLKVSRQLDARASKQHLSHSFQLPQGVTRLRARLDYEPGTVTGQPGRNLLSLSLFDPVGSRGAGHNRAENVIDLSAAGATPGYVPGPLPAGDWNLVIDTHMILPDCVLSYTLTIEADFEPVTEPAPHWGQGQPPQRGAGWFRGDLHSHTIHSDGSWDVPDLVAAARGYGLDFVTLTDHNTISPLPQIDSLAASDLLTMGGVELTTYSGHALALGVRRWIDWRVQPGERSMTDIAAEIEAEGGLFVIAHPMSPGDPVCTGCDWQYPDVMPGPAHVVEVWNGGLWSDYNEDGLALWYGWLNLGYRLAATAGTDAHGPAPAGLRIGFNHVYASALTETDILNAVRRGHNYLSAGPLLDFTAHTEAGAAAMCGDTLTLGPDETVSFDVRWERALPASRLRIIRDGKLDTEQIVEEQGTLSRTVSDGAWYTIELRVGTSELLAVTNPIFLERTA